MFDILIVNADIIDGTGKKRYKSNIGIKDNKIVSLGNTIANQATVVIDAQGLIVTPGFIDFHSHSDYFSLFIDAGARNMLEQGVTTQIVGQCGLSALPLSSELLKFIQPYISVEKYRMLSTIGNGARGILDYVSKQALGTNIAFLAGHGTIRTKVMGYKNSKPSPEELMGMKMIVRDSMEAGAIGLSTGLLYPPGVFALEDELIELCKVVKEYGGIYASHIRDEGNFVIESVQEAIRIGAKADLPVVISHHKIAGKNNWGKSKETLRLIEEANENGLKVRLDQYPYEASCTTLISAIPPQYTTEGETRLLEKLKNSEIREEIKAIIAKNQGNFDNLIYNSGLDGVLIVEAPSTKELCGKTVPQIAEELNKDPYDTIFDLIIENQGKVFAACFEMNEKDLERIMSCKYTMGGTDAAGSVIEIEAKHPRETATFIKILSSYVRDKKIVTLEEGIRKLTSMPADMAGLGKKGIIKEGYDADIVILDYENLRANADFANPSSPNEGIKYVLVNGKIAVKDDASVGVYAGEVILKSQRSKVE